MTFNVLLILSNFRVFSSKIPRIATFTDNPHFREITSRLLTEFRNNVFGNNTDVCSRGQCVSLRENILYTNS